MGLQVCFYTWPSFFKAHYYDNHFLAPVDLDKVTQKTILGKPKYQAVSTAAQKLVQDPEIQKAMAQPFTLEEKINKQRDALFKDKKFTACANNVIGGNFTGVLGHPNLPDWFIKTCGGRFDEVDVDAPQQIQTLTSQHGEANQVSTYESMLRIPMRKHLKAVAKEKGVMGKKEGFNFVLPKEKYLPMPNAAPNGTFGSRFCILSQKLDILSQEETVAAIEAMSDEDQKSLAQRYLESGHSGWISRCSIWKYPFDSRDKELDDCGS